jgi:hypothetical protein
MQIAPKASSLSQYGLTQVAKTTNILRNLNFDSDMFSSSFDSSGVNIEYKSTTDSDNGNMHFKIEANSFSSAITSLIVRGGYWVRSSHDTRYDIPSNCNSGVYTGDYDNDYVNLSIGSGQGSFIYAEINNPMDPQYCEVKTSTTWPVFDNDKGKIVLGFANCSSGVLNINQYWHGDVNDNYERPDSDDGVASPHYSSIDRSTTTGDLQLFGFEFSGGTTSVAVEDDGTGNLHIVYLQTGNTPEDCGFAASSPGTFGSGGISRGDHIHHITWSDNAGYADYSGIAGYANSGAWPTDFNHWELLDIDGDIAGDDHDGTMIIGNYPYVSGRGINRNGNAFLDGATIDDASYVESIAPSARQLLAGNNAPTVFWGCCFAKNLSVEITVNWDTQELLTDNDRDLCWLYGVHELTNSWSCTKTFDAKKYEMSDDAANDYWSATGFIVSSTNLVDIYGANGLTISAQGGRAIVLDSDIDLQTGGELQINGVPGVSMTGYYVIDSIGNIHAIATTKGLLTTG